MYQYLQYNLLWLNRVYFVKARSTVGSSQVGSDGWRVSRHTSGRAPEAKPWTNERPGIFVEPHERAAEPGVEAVRVLAPRQLTAV